MTPAIISRRTHVILNLFQDLLTITNREILNSDNSRKLQRVTFQNDMSEKSLFLSCPPPHPNPLP